MSRLAPAVRSDQIAIASDALCDAAFAPGPWTGWLTRPLHTHQCQMDAIAAARSRPVRRRTLPTHLRTLRAALASRSCFPSSRWTPLLSSAERGVEDGSSETTRVPEELQARDGDAPADEWAHTDRPRSRVRHPNHDAAALAGQDPARRSIFSMPSAARLIPAFPISGMPSPADRATGVARTHRNLPRHAEARDRQRCWSKLRQQRSLMTFP